MSIVFLFGAGASYGNPDCMPHPPPLGKKLFIELKKESWVAAGLRAELCEQFEEDFEKGMDQLWDEEPTKVVPLQIHLARYFTKFRAGKDNFYKKIVEMAVKSRKKFVISTTNYDLLIEQAINDSGLYVSYTGLPARKYNVPLLKIHGSCNFLPAVQPNQIIGASFILEKGGKGVLDAPVRISTAEEAMKFCDASDSIAPAIAVYSKGKQVLHSDRCVDEHQRQWVSEAGRATKIFVVGLRILEHDDHIWGVIARSKAWLGYVGLEPEEFRDWFLKVERKNSFIVADTFEKAISAIERRRYL